MVTRTLGIAAPWSSSHVTRESVRRDRDELEALDRGHPLADVDRADGGALIAVQARGRRIRTHRECHLIGAGHVGRSGPGGPRKRDGGARQRRASRGCRDRAAERAGRTAGGLIDGGEDVEPPLAPHVVVRRGAAAGWCRTCPRRSATAMPRWSRCRRSAKAPPTRAGPTEPERWGEAIDVPLKLA